MSQSKDVAEKKSTAMAVPDYGEEAGSGFEGTSASDLSIPFISILQSNSPQVEEESPKGARPGLLYNTVTRELWDGEQGIVFLPVLKDQQFVEWVPRTKGGGFVALHAPDSQTVKEALAGNGGTPIGLKLGENDLVETYYVYGLVLDNEGQETVGFGVISFTSTKIKPYRDWMTAMYTLKGRPPLFANRALVKTQKQKNDKGTYFNFWVEPLRDNWLSSLIDPKNEADLLKEAREFRDMVQAGSARAAYETQGDTVGASGEGGEPAF